MTVEHRQLRSADGALLDRLVLGAGEPLILVGGVLSSAEDQLPLARELAADREVHVVERRGRGASAPQGASYAMEREVEDLAAAVAATGARSVFGHSYGGLVALRTAIAVPDIARVAVYEPGVSVRGSIPLGWLPEYRRRLEAGDPRGAFACMARGAGHAPAALGRLPLPVVRALLRVAIRPAQWRRMEGLLEPALREHEEVARLDGALGDYAAVAADVLLLAGGRSPAASTAALPELARVLPSARSEVLPGLDHLGPERRPAPVAAAVRAFLA